MADPDGRARLGLAVLALSLAVWGVHWYAGRPKPAKIAVSVIAPGAMPMKEGAKPMPLRLRFSASAAPLEAVGKPVSSGVTLRPPQPGSWAWTSDRELEFVPESDWPPGRRYEIRLDGKLFHEHAVMEALRHEFKSAAFAVSFAAADFNQDPTDPALKRVVATLRFTHPVDPVSLQERIFLEREGAAQGGFLGFGKKTFPFAVSYDEFKGEAYIHSDRITIGDKESSLKITLREGVRAAQGGEGFAQKIERSVSIPGIYTIFQIQDARLGVVRNAEYIPEQVLVLGLRTGAAQTRIAENLDVYLLPIDRPAVQGRPVSEKHYWSDVRQIGPEVLAASRQIALDALPADREYATTQSFRFKADPDRFLYVRIRKGVEAFGGYKLAETYDAILRVPQYPKEVKVMHPGSLLSLHGDKTVRVLSRGVPALRFDISRVRSGQINHFVSQSHGSFTNPSFYGQFRLDNMSERFTRLRAFPDPDPAATNYASLDLGEMLAEGGSPRGLFFLNVQAWDPVSRRPLGAADSRAILVTDLGIIVKEELGGSRAIFVSSLRAGGPVAGAEVAVLGLNGEAIASGKSGADGRVAVESLEGYDREKTPIAIVARKGDDLSFIPFSRSDRYLDMSRFDTGGARSSGLGDGLQAYLFSDRGIYRPGDELRVGLIVKGADWRRDLTGLPLEVSLTDARGLEVHKHRLRLSSAAFEDFKYRTEENSPTGVWRFSAYIVKDDRRHGLLDAVPLRVEEFLPDRLAIQTSFSTAAAQGWVSPRGLRGLVVLKNLYGTPAVGNAVAAKIALAPARPEFAGYRGYIFADPNREAKSFEEILVPGAADAEGKAAFDFNLKRFAAAIYQMRFYAEGFETAGGRSVASESSILVSDRKYLLGFNPGGKLDYMHKGSTRAAALLAIGPDLEPVAVDGLSLHAFERRHVSVLKRRKDGAFQYESAVRENLISSAAVAIAKTGLNYTLPTENPGEYRVCVRRQDGGEELEFLYTVVGDANVARSLEKAAQLQLRLSKTDFSPGEELEFQFNAPYAGTALVTLERERVYAHAWLRSTNTAGVGRIKIPPGLEGNGYLNVAFTRAANSPEIFMKPLSYGAAAFTVNRAERMIPVELDISTEARPGEAYRIRYKTDRPAKIIVFAIDEGILQAAGYETPAPLDKFLAKRALEVRTAQILDLILPDYSALPGLKAPGGGGFEALGKNLNPFRRRRDAPVAYWSGVVDGGADWRELEYAMPDYFNGTLRVMAVAVSRDAIGVGEAKGLLRAPFVITPRVPLFLAPGDRSQLTASVLNNARGSGENAEVKIQLRVDERLRVVGASRLTLKIPEGSEVLARFEVEALDRLGAAEAVFEASREGLRSRARAGLSVRPPVSYRTSVQSGRLKKGSAQAETSRRMHPHYRKLKASVSTLPLGLSHGLSDYLKSYPFGCTEQLVSRAFAALVLSRREGFGYSRKDAEESLDAALKVLRARQNAEGAFGFWAANSHVSPFQSVYAAHFLTELKDGGRPSGEDMLRRALLYVDGLGARDPASLSEARDSAYALYVLTRNGLVRTRAVVALHQRLKTGDWKGWEGDLAAVYLAGAYAQLNMSREAAALIGPTALGQEQESDYANFYDGLRRDGQLLYVWSKHFPDRLRRLGGEELESISGSIEKGGFNTISAAYSILAFDAYADAAGGPATQNIRLTQSVSGRGIPLPLPAGLFPGVAFSSAAARLRFDNPGPLPAFFQVTQAGFDLEAPKRALKNKIEIYREFRTESGEAAATAAVGETLTVVLRMRGLGDEDLPHVAVVDLLPAGFEPVRDPENPAYTGARLALAGSSWRPQHEDIREDRVLLFGTVGGKSLEYRYALRAVNAGRYRIPPAYAESMYDRSAQALSLGGEIEVRAAP